MGLGMGVAVAGSLMNYLNSRVAAAVADLPTNSKSGETGAAVKVVTEAAAMAAKGEVETVGAVKVARRNSTMNCCWMKKTTCCSTTTNQRTTKPRKKNS